MVLVAVASVLGMGTVADAGKQKKVVYLDYNYQPFVKPGKIFLQANSGPYLRKLKWTGWGTNKAIGRGQYVYDCASCIPNEKKPVKVTFRKLINCKHAPNIQIYRYGMIHVIDPKDNDRKRRWNGSCPPKGAMNR
jgi:hypothetical protein